MEIFGIQFHKKTDFSDCLIGPCLKVYLDIPQLTRYVKLDKLIMYTTSSLFT